MNRSVSPASTTATTGKISGGNYYWYLYDASRTTVTGKVSHHADSFLGAEQDFHFGVQYNQAGVSGVYGYNDFIYTYLSGGVQYGYGKVRSDVQLWRDRPATSVRSSTTTSGWAIG